MGLILGIDVGFTGALALYGAEHHQLIVLDMPVMKSKSISFKTGKHKPIVDPKPIVHLLRSHMADIKMAVVERLHASPGQGVSSTFRFGEQYGLIQGLLAAFSIRTLLVSPAVWKAELGVTADKKTSIDLARATWPKGGLFERMKDHGRAEASLLAWYGAEQAKSRLLFPVDSPEPTDSSHPTGTGND